MNHSRWRRAVCVFGLMLWWSAGCADQKGGAAGQLADQSPTTAPYPGQVIQLGDAKLLSTADDAVPALNLQSLVSVGTRTVYFGQFETYDDDDEVKTSVPVLARRDGTKVFGLPVRSDMKANETWAYVAGGPTKTEMWGIVDANLDDVTDDLLLVHSGDGGRSFAVQRLHKPHPAAQFDSFSMSREGAGRVSVYLARADAGPRGAGYYHYRTKDGGRTWSRAQYEHDSMLPAQEVPDSDESSPTQRAVLKASFTRHVVPGAGR